jgi:hypothetical protein
LGIADVMVHLGIQAESAAGLGEAWLAAQLACDRTPTGDLLGARIALAPERGKWRVHVVVPLLGRSFRSGKLNETPGGALRSAAVRLRRRAATLLLQPSSLESPARPLLDIIRSGRPIAVVDAAGAGNAVDLRRDAALRRLLH